MRTTVDIQDEVLARAKRVAAEQRRRLSDVVNDALVEALARTDRVAERSKPYRVLTCGHPGQTPEFDVSDNGALYDLDLEEARDPKTGQINYEKLR